MPIPSRFCSISSALSALLVIAISCGAFCSPLNAQDKKEKKELPEVEEVTLTTKDGVKLRCTWFPGQKEKKSVPVIMAHGWAGSRKEYYQLAEYYQKKFGYAVLIPDLRGHGDSTVTANGDEIDISRFKRTQIASVVEDFEACRKFLKEKNNEGELNLEMLTVIAGEQTAIMATNWAILDWSFPEFNNKRQGQFVKALVFLSPPKSFKGLALTKSMREPVISGRGSIPLSMMIAVGKGKDKTYRDARSLYNSIEKLRPPVKLKATTAKEKAEERWKKQTLYFQEFDVAFQGTKLIHPKAKLPLADSIAQFIYNRLEKNESQLEWKEF